MTLTFPMRRVAIGCLMVTAGLAGTTAAAGTTNYLVTGQLDTAPSQLAAPGGLDASSFELRLAFDEPTQFDRNLTSFGAGTFVFVAETWSLAYLDDDGLIAQYDGGGPATTDDRGDSGLTAGESYGFVNLTGGITGPGTSDTLLELGIAEAAGEGETPFLEPSLFRAEFYEPVFIEATFTNQLIDIPDDLTFQEGEAFDEFRGVNLDVLSASLRAVSIDDGIVLAPVQDNGDPNAIPTPGAAAGGALLMMGLLSRRRRAAANAS